MVTAIVITVVLLLLSIAGVVKAMRDLRGVLRVLLAVAGVLFSFFLILVLAGEALFYKFAPETVDFDPRAHAGPTGKIVTPLNGDLTLSLFKTKSGQRMQLVRLTSKDGVFIAPTGDYRLMSCDQSVEHGGAEWQLSSRIDRTFNVMPGSSFRLDIGPPYVASVEVGEMRGSNIDLSLRILGRAGENCSIMKADSPPPGFQISSTEGKVLQEGKFRYG